MPTTRHTAASRTTRNDSSFTTWELTAWVVLGTAAIWGLWPHRPSFTAALIVCCLALFGLAGAVSLIDAWRCIRAGELPWDDLIVGTVIVLVFCPISLYFMVVCW